MKLPVAIIGPNEMVGLKLAPVNAPAIMMFKVTVIPIASGAQLSRRPLRLYGGGEHDDDEKKGEHGLDHESGLRA